MPRQAPRQSRRNMLKYRTMSGVAIGGTAILAANFLPLFGIWLLLLAISGVAQLEFYAMIKKAGFPSFRILGTVCGSLLISATFFSALGGSVDPLRAYNLENGVLLISILAVFVRQFPQKHNDKPLETIGCTLLGIWYVPFLLNFFTRLAFSWDASADLLRVSQTGRSVCLFVIVVVKSSDIGAYFVGRAFGCHKLFPRISPKKTWEGLLGGVAAAILVSWLVFFVAGKGRLGDVELHLRDVFLLGVLLPVVGVVGDMFESLLKRAAGLKDSGSVIPGMGGVLDVLDSLLFGAPFLYVSAQVFWT